VSVHRLAGWPRLPDWLVQPFELSFAPDDLHVMAYLSGHPEYEAVEAMIRLRAQRQPLVRAILTRHDQSQVDHVNDAAPRRTVDERERCLRDICCALEDAADSRRVRIRFESFRGESVEMEIASLGVPDANRGGLSDPGGHSARSSLPVMHRGRSALAAPASRVTIDGRPIRIPTRIEAGGRVIALEGFFTELHHMAALRSGTRDLELVEKPSAFAAGERWTYRSGDETFSYRIARRASDGGIEATRLDSAVEEEIRAVRVGDEIELIELRTRHPDDARHFAALRFSAGAFAIAIGDAEGLVSGTVEQSGAGERAGSITLLPAAPAWAVDRRVTVRFASVAANRISLRTTIG